MCIFNRRRGQSGGIATDSILLVFVRIVTMSVSIIQAMILSRTFTKTDYGTYSQGILIISFLSPIASLGLENAVNYFFNKFSEKKKKQEYIDTIFSVSFLSGIICGLLILLFRNVIVDYFNNSAVLGLILYIAFRPCIQNLISLYQPVFISSGYAKIIAVRNLIISIVQILIVGSVSYFFNDIKLIFLLLLLLDISQLICFSWIYRKREFAIRVIKINFNFIKEILVYAVPMMVSSSIGTISINLDKLMISGLMSTEDFALYSNVSKELPFSFIASSFTAVVTPYLMKHISRGEKDKFKKLWSEYLELGYKVTWPLCVGAAVLSPEIIQVLYSDTYLTLDGVIVFCLYTIVAMFRFTYFGIVPASLGRTKVILIYSAIGCAINVSLNYPLYLLMGMPGPALATVVSMIISSYLYFRESSRLVQIKITEVLKPSKIIILFSEMLCAGSVTVIFARFIESKVSNIFICFGLEYFLFVGIVYSVNARSLLRLIRSMNNENLTS